MRGAEFEQAARCNRATCRQPCMSDQQLPQAIAASF
ncbi:hypothetical protein [Pseudomonas sp. TWR2-1-1]